MAWPRPCASLIPNRIERNAEARNVVYIVRSKILVQLAAIDEELQRKQPRHVGLGLLDGAVGVLQLLANGCRTAADGDVVRAEAVHQLVHQDVREERVERDVGPDRPRPARRARSAPGPC